jgi:hypothetical protein
MMSDRVLSFCAIRRLALHALVMKLYGMKTSEAFPNDSWLETQFTCFDEDKPDRESDSRWHTYIGNVHQVPA